MQTNDTRHFRKLSLSLCPTKITAKPQVSCKQTEIADRLQKIKEAVNHGNYVPPEPTSKNRAMFQDYRLDTSDQDKILLNLDETNFVAKIKDVGTNANAKKTNRAPQEYYYVFQFFCRLQKIEMDGDKTVYEDVLIYIKIKFHANSTVIIKSFHKDDKDDKKN